MGRMIMNYLGKRISNACLVPASIVVTLCLAGCGDSEIAKGITDVVKKSVEGEVSKKAGEIKKQIDQVVKPGAGKGQKEEGQGGGKDGKEKSKKDSDKESAEEKE
jgi:hypothetical protein